MSANFLPFALPELGEEEIREVADSLRSGWLTTGPKTRKFEADFSAWLGGGVESVAVNSATAGLHLGLEALGIGPGDEVITTTYTFTATAEVVRYLGADPVFVDITPETLCISPDLIDRAVTNRTKAIMPVHFAGRAADMSAVLRIAHKHGLGVVEDAAHALTTTYEGRLVGSLESDITVFSFYANKTITTGEGGMLVTRNPEVARRTRVMRLHGISRDAFDRFVATKPSWHYEVVAPGFKYNLTDIASAIGIHQLPKAQGFRQRRAEIAARYDEAFAGLPIELPPQPVEGDQHAWHLYVIRLAHGARMTRDEFVEAMYARGIGMSVHYVPLHLHPYWKERYSLSPEMFPVSQDVYQRTASLPIYSRMTDGDVNRVIFAVQQLLG